MMQSLQANRSSTTSVSAYVCAVVMLLVASVSLDSTAQAASMDERLMVAFDTRSDAQGPPWDVTNYGIRSSVYTPNTLEEGFVADLQRARLLVLCRASADENLVLFEESAYREAVTAFLKKGGVILFQYHAGPKWWLSTEAKQYFDDIGLGVYQKGDEDGWYIAGQDYYGIAPATTDHPLLTTPNSADTIMRTLSGDRSAYGYYANPSDRQRALFHEEGHPDRAAMLIQDDVLGKGTVMMTRIYPLARQRRSQPLVENILAYAFGSLEQGMAVSDQQESPQPQVASLGIDSKPMNPLYMRELVDKAWWHKAWSHRLPLVVFEPADLRRQAAPVRFVHTFPSGTVPESIRVVTPWDKILPAEVRAVDDQRDRYEVLFTTDMLPGGYQPLFVYSSDQPVEDEQAQPSPIGMERSEYYLTLRNNRIQATLHRQRPELVGLQPLGAATGNQFFDAAGMSPEGWGVRGWEALGVDAWDVSVRQTPVRTVVTYRPADSDGSLRITYALRHDATRIDYAIDSSKAQSFDREIGYLPGRGFGVDADDHLYFAGDEHLRQLAIRKNGQLTERLGNKEGWYAFEDTETSNLIGELFDPEITGRINVYVNNHVGYHVRIRTEVQPNRTTRGAYLVRTGGGAASVRSDYLRHKHPLRVQIGAVQDQSQAPAEPTVPVLGENLIRTFHLPYWHYGNGFMMKFTSIRPDKPETMIPSLLRGAKRIGANYISVWAYRPIWPSEFVEGSRATVMESLVEQAHAAGLGVAGGAPHLERSYIYRNARPEGWKPDEVANRDYFVQVPREFARTGADMVVLRDEDTYTIGSDEAKELFQSRYDVDPVDQVDPKALTDPAHHNTALFNMDVYTESLRDMAEGVREQNPDILVLDQVNISSMTRIERGAPHDYERHAEFLDTLSMDLYGRPSQSYKFYVKYMRGAFNNDRPIVLYSGLTAEEDVIKLNQNYLLMWGADALFNFPPGALYTSLWEGLQRHFYWLDYTGLGDMLARYHPARDVAIFNDRNGLIHSIRQGNWGSMGSGYLKRLQNLTHLSNVQTDILFSKDCSVSNLDRYNLLVVPDNPVIEKAHVEAMRRYIESGGRVLIEGHAIEQPAVQDLVGAVPGGDAERRSVEVQADAPFNFNGQTIPLQVEGAEVRQTFEDGGAALIERQLGEGSVFYTPMIVSEQVLYQREVGAWVRGLIDQLADDMPLSITAGESLDTNLFTDGQDYILAVHNNTSEARELELATADISSSLVVVDFATGAQQKLDDSARLQVPAQQVHFFYIGAPETMRLPEHRMLQADAGIEYSASPGEDIRKLIAARSTEKGTTPESADAPDDGQIFIGVVSDKGEEAEATNEIVWGDEAIHEALSEARGIRAELTTDLRADALARYDAVVVPRLGHRKRPPALPEGWEAAVREYVHAGGAALLCHHAAGSGPVEYAPFPSVGEPTGEWIEEQTVRIVAEHPITTASALKQHFPELADAPEFDNLLEETVMEAGMTFQSSFPDYIPLRPGPNGEIVARGTDETAPAVVLAGTAGQGRVVLCGTAMGAAIGEETRVQERLTHGERHLLRNTIHWLAESK